MRAFVRDSTLRIRYDRFGGLAWKHQGLIYELSSNEIQILDVLGMPRGITEVNEFLGHGVVSETLDKLLSEKLIFESDQIPAPIQEFEKHQIKEKTIEAGRQKLNKPFWVHIQPFTFCNQKCLHCYCHGGINGSKFKLPLTTWESIIDKLYDFGILEVYVTGGENLIVDDCIQLLQMILQKGFITGLSTNAMKISSNAIGMIQKHKIDYVQVSIDGASSNVNDYIRGHPGALQKAKIGIRKLSNITNVIFNTVVCTLNIKEIEDIILLGKSLNVSRFNFFPLKNTGRASRLSELRIDEMEWSKIDFDALSSKHQVDIDYLKSGSKCGNGVAGFALDENADVFPCIFGVSDKSQIVGNLINTPVETVWFDSPSLQSFRDCDDTHPCRRCENPIK